MRFFNQNLNYFIKNRGEINPEDTLVDGQDEDPHLMEEPMRKKHFRWLYSLAIFALVVLLARSGWLQIVKGEYYKAQASQNQIQIQKIEALRGIIYDRDKTHLASNIPGPWRYYPEGNVLAHLIGYVSKIDKKGETGLELVYEDELRGEPGHQYLEVDSLGKVKRTIALKDPKPGNNLLLHLDLKLQRKIYELLENKEKAVGLAIDPRNGGILALVNIPSFDNNLFPQGISEKDYQGLINDPARPLFNRAIGGEYAPGSTIKPLIAAAALEEQVVDQDEIINDDKGYLRIVHQYDPNIVYIFGDWKAHGPIKMKEAIAESCNVYFYTVGQRLGLERIKKYARLFGLDKILGIDLPGEASGFIPSQGSIGDIYHASIGQGDIALTPLQLATYTAAIANGGTLYQSQVIDKILDSKNNLVKDIKPKIIQTGFINQKNLKVIQQGMAGIMSSSFGWRLRDLPQNIAGKTGTAQIGRRDKTHAWFTSYAPADNPEIVLTILIEEGGGGSKVALPIAKEIYKWYLNR